MGAALHSQSKASGVFTPEKITQFLVFGSSPEATAGDILEMSEQKAVEQQPEIEDLAQLRASLLQLALDRTGEGSVRNTRSSTTSTTKATLSFRRRIASGRSRPLPRTEAFLQTVLYGLQRKTIL